MVTDPQAPIVPRFDHLLRLTGPFGLLEHASHDQPRPHHGLCTDDNGRALVVLCRARHLSPDVLAAFDRYLRYVEEGRTPDGWRNRRHLDGHWTDDKGPDDCHGRALWGLGVAARHAPEAAWRARAAAAYAAGTDLASPHPRAMAYATLGAVEALAVADTAPAATRRLEAAGPHWSPPRPGAWRWPADRLTYANARIPEAMIAAGDAMVEPALVDDGLDLLDWLVATESGDTGFSFTPVAGRGPGEHGPAFDQQPIEAWAMADACARAATVSGESMWTTRRDLAIDWFLGRNDGDTALYDPETGAGYDGLTADGVNRNQGAESTLAALAALLLREDR